MAFGSTAHNAHTVLPCFRTIDIHSLFLWISDHLTVASESHDVRQDNSGRTSLENEKEVTES